MLGRAASGVLGRTASGILERRNKVTAEELLASSDLTGKTVVVTGGTSGKGRERQVIFSRLPRRSVTQQTLPYVAVDPAEAKVTKAVTSPGLAKIFRSWQGGSTSTGIGRRKSHLHKQGIEGRPASGGRAVA